MEDKPMVSDNPVKSIQVHQSKVDIKCRACNSDVESSSEILLPHLSLCRKLCYSVGHTLNDICAAMWFTYLLIYLHSVMKFNNLLAGYLMLLGQIVDGVSTPLVGYESDRTEGFWKLGCRKTWYLVGTICVVFSFPFLFNPAIDGLQHSSEVLFVYYAPFVVLFQFGWASTQISHLALIPELTPLENERVELNSLRYGFTVLSNIFVFSVAWLLLSLNHISTDSDDASPTTFDTLQPSDAGRFRILVFTVLATGLVLVTIFFIGTKENRRNVINDFEDSLSTVVKSGKVRMRWVCWLKEPQFYQVGVLYMCSRLFTNICQIYLPMFLLMTVHMEKESIAIIPLIVYASGFIAAFLMKKVNIVLGRKITYFIGILVGVCACVDIYYLQTNSKHVYFVACLIGFSGSTMLVTALSMTADFISCNTETGAFVYGAMSFTDKISNGIAVVIIQHLHPNIVQEICGECAEFYKKVLTFVPAGSLVLATVVLATLFNQTIGKRRKLRMNIKKHQMRCDKIQNDESKKLLSNCTSS